MPGDGEYAVEKFYTDSRDNKGHAASYRIQIPTGLGNELAELIASKRIPDYRTVADVFRDALTHRLHWLKDEFHIDTLERPVTMYTLRCEAERQGQMREDSEAACRVIEENLRMAGSRAELDRCKETATSAMELAEEPYKTRLRTAIQGNEYRVY